MTRREFKRKRKVNKRNRAKFMRSLRKACPDIKRGTMSFQEMMEVTGG